MYEEWNPPQTKPESPEFLVSAEVYIPNGASGLLKKPGNQRSKKPEKQSTSVSEDSKKLREKSSWLTLTKGTYGTGQWRSALCKLREEGDRCLMNIYVDESILYQTIYVHLLHQTDIRHADNSLFFRKACLGIYAVPAQRWVSNQVDGPIYLQFPNIDICQSWFSLLRSYAIPEIYGRWFFPQEGGSYRMWRQVELSIIQGRGLGSTRGIAENGVNADGDDGDQSDQSVFCEVHVNGIIFGVTTEQKGSGSYDWHETFTFSDLPPFESLDIKLWRDKKLSRPIHTGSIKIALPNFRRGEKVDGWFPVLRTGAGASDIQVGEVRLYLRVDEEIILPNVVYKDVLKTLTSCNLLEWMTDFESRPKLKLVAPHLVYIAIARKAIVEEVGLLAAREVETASSHQTLFRGNSTFTKVMEQCMNWYGKAFLEASIGPVIRRLYSDKVSIEVDPARSNKQGKDHDRSVDQLVYWCKEIWNQIYVTRTECPREIRQLFRKIRTLVEGRYRDALPAENINHDLPKQAVSAFCFLRFIVPAILHPHLFKLCPGLPIPGVQRSLTLIAKVIQRLANFNIGSAAKEDFMAGVNTFIRESSPGMVDYIMAVSTPNDDIELGSNSAFESHRRLPIVNHIRERSSGLPLLDRESIPALPYLLDIPKHLALITTAVVRDLREHQSRTHQSNTSRAAWDELAENCIKVEESALRRVSQLAAEVSLSRQQDLHAQAAKQISRPSAIDPTRRQARRPKLTRPSTAPSPTPSDGSSMQHRLFGEFPTPPASRVLVPTTDIHERTAIRPQRHLTSPSTDSIPKPVDNRPEAQASISSPMNEGKKGRNIFRGILKKTIV